MAVQILFFATKTCFSKNFTSFWSYWRYYSYCWTLAFWRLPKPLPQPHPAGTETSDCSHCVSCCSCCYHHCPVGQIGWALGHWGACVGAYHCSIVHHHCLAREKPLGGPEAHYWKRVGWQVGVGGPCSPCPSLGAVTAWGWGRWQIG